MEIFDDLPEQIRQALAAVDFDVNVPSKIVTVLFAGEHPDDIVAAIHLNDRKRRRR
jgi:hypothetical protein